MQVVGHGGFGICQWLIWVSFLTSMEALSISIPNSLLLYSQLYLTEDNILVLCHPYIFCLCPFYWADFLHFWGERSSPVIQHKPVSTYLGEAASGRWGWSLEPPPRGQRVRIVSSILTSRELQKDKPICGSQWCKRFLLGHEASIGSSSLAVKALCRHRVDSSFPVLCIVHPFHLVLHVLQPSK